MKIVYYIKSGAILCFEGKQGEAVMQKRLAGLDPMSYLIIEDTNICNMRCHKDYTYLNSGSYTVNVYPKHASSTINTVFYR